MMIDDRFATFLCKPHLDNALHLHFVSDLADSIGDSWAVEQSHYRANRLQTATFISRKIITNYLLRSYTALA